jgi:hypothetical protein
MRARTTALADFYLYRPPPAEALGSARVNLWKDSMSRPIHNLTGKRFGRLKVERFAFIKGRHAYWHCRCQCGAEKDIRQDTLVNRETLSCSCRKIAILKKRSKRMRTRIATAASRARWKKQ